MSAKGVNDSLLKMVRGHLNSEYFNFTEFMECVSTMQGKKSPSLAQTEIVYQIMYGEEDEYLTNDFLFTLCCAVSISSSKSPPESVLISRDQL